MTEKQIALVFENDKLIHYVISKCFSPQPHEYDEFYAAGRVGLINAAREYNEDVGKFSTFAFLAIQRTIMRDVIMPTKRQKYIGNLEVSFETIVGGDYTDCSLWDVVPSNVDVEREVYVKQIMDKIRSILDDREWKILMMTGQGYSQAEIAKPLGISRQRVRHIYERAKERIINHIKPDFTIIGR